MRRCFFISPAGGNVDLHVYVLAELVEHSHQPVNGEAAELHRLDAVEQGAGFGLQSAPASCPS